MRKLLLASLALAGLGLSGQAAWAGCCGAEGCDSGCAAPCLKTECVYVDQPCTGYRPEWHEREVVVPVNKLVQHEVTEHQTVCINVPVWTEQVKCRTVCVQVPHEVCHEVTCTHMVQSCVVDPCTGCSTKVCRPETCVKQVKTTCMETLQKQETYTEKVCTYHQEQQTVEIKKMVCEFQHSTEKQTENYCVMVPYATTVRVPTCQQVTPAPCTPVTSGCMACGHGGCGCGH